MTQASPEPASRVRYEVMAATALMSLLLYLDRFCISMAEPEITKEFQLSRPQMGLVFSSFFLSYAFAQVPTGWLGDRLGPRLMLSCCVLTWSLLTGLMGLVNGLTMLIVVRLLLGISQAGAYPIAARIISLWMPYPNRALGNGLVTMGGRLGGALAPSLTAVLIAWFSDDWRPAFWVYAGFGVLWTFWFALRYRNSPLENPRCNPAELELIVESRPPEASNPHGKTPNVPWLTALQSRGLWMQCLAQVASNVAWLFLSTWLPRYLLDQYNLSKEMTGFLSSLPLLAGMFGCLFGGIAADRLTRRLGIKWGRNLLGMGSKLLAGVWVIASVLAGDPYLATAALALAAFTNDLGLSPTWAYFQDAGGPYVGPLLGFANMFGNLGATASPLLLAYISREWSWNAALLTCAAMFVVSGLSWLGLDGRIPIVPERGQ